MAWLRDGRRNEVTKKPAASERRKVSYIGAPACFALEMACKQVVDAFRPKGEGRHGQTYVVGSSLERADWRDIDIRLVMDDESFADLFPNVRLDTGSATWEFDPRWTLITVSVTAWLRQQTGLPIDFQIQPMTFANEKHKGQRHAIGLHFADK
jgi:hypothetical protein